ncbi:MAG TPA: transposase [Candidatus Nitrosotenuis sp.]|nr:transposase [Candidatus Nitrosotenuis sp.]
MLAVKSVKQSFSPDKEILQMMNTFKDMVNHCIRIGLQNDISNMKRLSVLSYQTLKDFDTPSYYKINAISQAAGRLAQRKHDVKEGKKPKPPFIKKPFLVNCYRLKINGMLFSFPTTQGQRNFLLNDHTVKQLSDHGIKVKSFTMTTTSLSFCIKRDVSEIKPDSAIGIDRNLRNVTMSTPKNTIMYRTEKILSIKQNSQHVRNSFRRFDVRVKNKFHKKHKGRQMQRVNQHLHKISKDIVQRAKDSKSMIVFENLKGIRRLYKKGNGQGKKYRQKLNSWSFYELQKQVEYKARWEGILVKFVDPKRTSKLCPICGGKIQEDGLNRRKVLCNNCGKIMDRDVVASMNIAYKGWSRFCHPRGLPDEVMRGNADRLNPLILRVHGSKLVSVNSPIT